MNRHSSRSRARAIAKTDESRTRLSLVIRATVIAAFALSAIIALPSLF